MQTRSRILIVVLLFLLSLSACAPRRATSSGMQIPGLAQTLAAQTLTAQQGQTSPFLYTPTPPPPAAQPAEIAQAAPLPPTPELPQSTPDKKITTGEEVESCTNAAQFVQDISFPDETRVKPLQRFTKTWQFKNVGTCTWTPEYSLVYVWGDKLAPADAIPIGQTVEPGKTVNISVSLVAPKLENFYQCNWMFQDPHGETFGTGYRARGFFWVAINVSGGNGGPGGCAGGG